MSSKSRASTARYLGVFLLVLGLVTVIPMNAAGQGTLTLTLNRNVGMAFGNFIQGSFTLRGSGPENVQNLTVYFNGEEVHFVTGNSVVWVFNTGDYQSGLTNITLFGVDDVGGTYYATRQVTFLGPAVANVIIVIVLVLAIVLIIAKYGPRLARSRKK